MTCNCDVRLCQCLPIGDDTAADLLGLKTTQDLTEAMQTFSRTIQDVSDRLIQVGKQFLQSHESIFGNAPAYDAAISRDGAVIRNRRHGKNAAYAALRNGGGISAADLNAATPPPMPTSLKSLRPPPTTLEDATCCTFHAGGIVLRDQSPLAVRSHPHASQDKGRLNRR